VENSLWWRLWTCPKTDCEIMIVSYARVTVRNQRARMLMEVIWLIFKYFASTCLTLMSKMGIFSICEANLQVHELKPKRLMRSKCRPRVIISEMRY